VLLNNKIKQGVQEGRSPSFQKLPLSLIGEGDTGGEVDKKKRVRGKKELTFPARRPWKGD